MFDAWKREAVAIGGGESFWTEQADSKMNKPKTMLVKQRIWQILTVNKLWSKNLHGNLGIVKMIFLTLI